MKKKWTPKPSLVRMGETNYKQIPLPLVERNENNQRVIRAALEALDTATREMDQRWGIGELQKLVDPEVGARFERARQNLEYAIASKDVNLIVSKANNLGKGWKLLTRMATDAGHRPIAGKTPIVWYHRGPDNEKYAIVKEGRDLARVPTEACDRAYSLDEICRILAHFERENEQIRSIKGSFPGCEITGIRHKRNTGPRPDWAPF